MKRMKRIIFTVGIFSVISVTARYGKMFADNPSMIRLLASQRTPYQNALLFEKTFIAGHHTGLDHPNQVPNLTAFAQPVSSPGVKRRLASSTPHENIYIAAIANREIEPINSTVSTSVDDIHG